MKNDRILIILLCLGILLTAPTCGKKGPPFLPQKELSVKVADLTGEWVEEYILLKGNINGLKETEKAMDLVKGCRVYYGEYTLDNPPCEGCPIEYHGYHGFGPEVVTEERFLCRVPGKIQKRIYYFKIHLIGSGGVIGPPSNRIRVAVE